MLLQGGANIDARDKTGATALMWAVAKGKMESAKLLKEEGANLDVGDSRGRTALDIAKATGRKDMEKILTR